MKYNCVFFPICVKTNKAKILSQKKRSQDWKERNAKWCWGGPQARVQSWLTKTGRWRDKAYGAVGPTSARSGDGIGSAADKRVSLSISPSLSPKFLLSALFPQLLLTLTHVPIQFAYESNRKQTVCGWLLFDTL